MNAGDIISGRYRLHSRIGEGGQASVWKATDLTLNREVAIKFIYASDAREREELATRFLREARICAAVRHRNVVQILDFGTAAESVPYMVLELLEGETVADRLDVGMEMQEILEVAVKTLEGLAEVHAAGIVHRDLKPENILLVRDSSGTHPKLLDFGISKMLDSDGVSRSAVTTRIGQVIGTPEYMSPEQARGLKSLDHRTDLYAMGVVIYETIAGRAPYEHENVGDLMMMVIKGKAPPLIERAPGVGQAISDVVMKAMALEPEDRYRDAHEMRDALVAAARQTFQGFAPQSVPLPRPRTRRRMAPTITIQRSWLLPGAVTVAVLIAAAVGLAITRPAATTAESPRYIVVKGNDEATAKPTPTPKPSPEPAPAAADEPAATPEPTAQHEPQAKPKSKARLAGKKPDQVTRLTRAFTRQKASVERCLASHAQSVGDSSRLSVRIALDGGGRVTDATVSPASLGQGPAGGCIATAVRKMRFGKQPQAVAFRVPLTARRNP